MIYSPLSKHLFIIEDKKSRKTIALEDIKYTIGRHADNQIVIASTQASRFHATLVRKVNSQNQDYSYWILDGNLEGCKSQNGIYVNGEKCLVHELKNGDLINFGCEVNASYHHINNVFETLIQSDYSSQIDKNNSAIGNSISQNKNQRTLDFTTSNYLDTSNQVDATILENNYLDSLTQLPNLKLFNEHLSLAINNAQKIHKVLAVFLVEAENFLKINQQLGSDYSKQLISEYTKKIKNSLRSGDIVASIKEDKFIILISQINSFEDIQTISQRILKNVKEPIEINEKPYFIRTNIGIGTYPNDSNNGQELIHKAEINLQITKQKTNLLPLASIGKKSVHTLQFYQIEKLLHEAIENEEFSLYYQPQVNVNTGEIQGIEALLRWEHPKYGLLTPRRFLPVAEKTELIIPITQWILKTACEQNLDWIKSGLSYLPISVNISPRLFQSLYLTKMLSQVLLKTGLDGSLLELEFTENNLLENIEESNQVLQTIKEMKIKMAIDDFGLGYASLNYLNQLPISKLKIAQSLIRELKYYPQKTALISAIIASGQILDKQVVAEGVETQQQLEILQSLRCDQIQGYFYSQPLTAIDVAQLFTSPRTLISR
ncbi:EAL domain-containing protein [Chroococcus sp. FPU101]|uniref:EAL domain-containing protein n=1 Tax=Chroococcus sp. FPU101 TaxID=1974212 RepID=UPI001A8D35A8|nr:EAL domain-containing protein [Chroococcus sp. FPU101]GFE71792.1 diguanylate cyclase/phosphodiesterase [Chroococcus sp. FPU101]